jgi:hypothetical protein
MSGISGKETSSSLADVIRLIAGELLGEKKAAMRLDRFLTVTPFSRVVPDVRLRRG